MTQFDTIEMMKTTALTLVIEGIVRANGCISCLLDNTLFITSKDADLSSLTENMISEFDIETLTPLNIVPPAPEYHLHLAIYQKRKDIQAIIHSTQLSCTTSSKAGITILPLLDDMAQIAGTTVKIADCPDNATPTELKQMLKKLKGRNAVGIKNTGILCAASSLYDAHAVAMVMEKACKSFIESTLLGKSVVINKIEAALMRFVYLKKYSKQDQKNK